jgi:phospholipid transport system substrate-binding protein
MKNMLRVFLLGLVTFFAVSTSVSADDEHPQALVEAAIDNVLTELKENAEEIKADSNKIYELVQTTLIPHFDFDKMSKLALGKNWRNATEAQRARFVEEFRLLLVRTYSTALSEYAGQEIRFIPFKGDVASKKVKVDMEIVQTGGASIPMSLSIFQDEQDNWKVYDVKVDGISLVTNYRTSFANEIRKDGMDKLIERLAERNQKVKV